MIKNKRKTNLYTLISFVLLMAIPCLANSEIPTANNQPIAIDADNQEIDIQKNMITFTGNVVIVQDSLKVTADTVVINNMQDKNGQTITAYGSPVYFHQNFENGKNIDGHADQLSYDVAQNQVVLTGKAKLTQQDNNITGETIIYKINEQQISAKGDSNNRVKTVLVPNQLKEID